MNIMLDPGALMPRKAHAADAGFDLFAREDFTVPPCRFSFPMTMEIGSATHDTGVHIEIPFGYEGSIVSKSGLNVKHGLTCFGQIDSGYTGSMVVKLYNHTSRAYQFHKGDKIAQLVVRPILIDYLRLVDEFEPTERGSNGFGSTGP